MPGRAYAAVISLVARIGSFNALHRAVRFCFPWPRLACLPEVYAGHADTGILSDFGNAEATLDPGVAEMGGQAGLFGH